MIAIISTTLYCPSEFISKPHSALHNSSELFNITQTPKVISNTFIKLSLFISP